MFRRAQENNCETDFLRLSRSHTFNKELQIPFRNVCGKLDYTTGDVAFNGIENKQLVIASGEYDLKLSIDPDEIIPEKDDGNNVEYLVVSGARPSSIGAVTSFMPALFLLIAVAGWMAWTMRSTKEE